ncbi:MAG: hypothetical protein IH925_04645 [Proteobacteria bacterium]|nr:hypothetical protein [Pseudomonadota bacterium]
MTISGVTASAVSALTANAARVAAVADNVANVGTVGFKATEVRTTTLVTRQGAGGGFAAGGVQTVALEQSNVDLAGEFANLVQARVAYGFAVAVLRTADEMLSALLDIRA